MLHLPCFSGLEAGVNLSFLDSGADGGMVRSMTIKMLQAMAQKIAMCDMRGMVFILIPHVINDPTACEHASAMLSNQS